MEKLELADMTEVMEEKDLYLSDFSRFERALAQRSGRLYDLRHEAIDRFAELGFPTLRDEEWRFTNLAGLAKTPFTLARGEGGRPAVGGVARSGDRAITERGSALEARHRLVVVNGHFVEKLSTLPPGPVFAGGLAAALASQPQLVECHLARYAEFEEQAFTALNTAFVRDGALIYVPDNQVVQEPIHLVVVSAGGDRPTVSHPRVLVVVGRNSRVTLVETYTGAAGEVYFTNAVTEIVAGENAVVDHYKLQEEGAEAFHVATLQVQQARSSIVSSHFVSLGGRLVRNEVNAVLDAPGCECTLNGLYLASGRQHIDNHTVIEHAKPHCTSHELYKGILDGQAHGVFNGKIHVHQDAQKTDAKQTNQTLLLSADAVINTKPQLEIYADDVKCTHGATVGQLSDEALFYLRSRGIDAEAARGLLTYAFANDIVGRIKVVPVRRRLEEVLLASQGLPAEARREEV
jgi:Fe-S cluster assembly protein SufD